MNKADLIDAVAESADISKAAAARCVDTVFDTITASLAKGDNVTVVGFGTFSVAYPLYRSPSVRLFNDHAHNDLLQAWTEGGTVGLILLLLLLVPLIRRLVSALSGARGPGAVGIAAGLTALMLHALVDFNFHIPANAAIAAVLAGGILGLPWSATDSSSSDRRSSAA